MIRDDEPVFTPAEEQRFDELTRRAEAAYAVLNDLLADLRAALARAQAAGKPDLRETVTLGFEIKAVEVCLLVLSTRVALFSKRDSAVS